MRTNLNQSKEKPVLFGWMFLLWVILSSGGLAQAQIRNVIVENYYAADANDLTDTLGGRHLSPGSKTYRIYAEVYPGSKIRKLYGDSLHPLRLSSDSVFYNNNDRPSSEFGYEIQSSWFEDNPLLALDSWLTLGLASKNQKGVLKVKDNNGGSIAGLNNLGGTAAIPGGLLVNNDPWAGIPLTTADGLLPNTSVAGTWVDVGFKDVNGDTTVFGADSIGNEFSCYACALQQSTGVSGADVDSNVILLAQLTTNGAIRFELNLTLEQTDSNGVVTLVDYVATDDSLRPGEIVSPYLSYPLACGCNDPAYLEYSATYTCLHPDSCKTIIVFGCMDSMACNFNPAANYNLSSLCCYPGLCNDLDISLVCPSLNLGRSGSTNVLVYPNPSHGLFTVEVRSDKLKVAKLEVINALGVLVYSADVALENQAAFSDLKLESFPDGMYLVRLSDGNSNQQARIIKN